MEFQIFLIPNVYAKNNFLHTTFVPSFVCKDVGTTLINCVRYSTTKYHCILVLLQCYSYYFKYSSSRFGIRIESKRVTNKAFCLSYGTSTSYKIISIFVRRKY